MPYEYSVLRRDDANPGRVVRSSNCGLNALHPSVSQASATLQVAGPVTVPLNRII